MTQSLDDWDRAGKLVIRVYREELGRDVDFAGAVNWLAHWREQSNGAEGFEPWLRARFRESEEWQRKHGTPPVEPSEPPVPEPPVSLGGPARVIRVTTTGDYAPRMYSYWSNAYLAGGDAFVFAGRGGSARLFGVTTGSGSAHGFDWPFSYGGTTEGWYWDASGRIVLISGTQLRRVNPFTKSDELLFDIADEHPGCILWQAHSSDDGQTHSATVKRVVSDGAYPAIGTVVYRKGRQEYYPAQGDLDESQVDASGRWLVIKESENNRIIDLQTRDTRMIADADGAVGHSDCGDGILVGEDNIHGACVLWDLRGPLAPSRRKELFSTWNMGYVSLAGGRCLRSTDNYLSLVALDGSGETQIVQHGVTGNDYDKRVKANLDPTGRVATYMVDGDVYLAVLPS